jgi:hypothetical protein
VSHVADSGFSLVSDARPAANAWAPFGYPARSPSRGEGTGSLPVSTMNAVRAPWCAWSTPNAFGHSRELLGCAAIGVVVTTQAAAR